MPSVQVNINVEIAFDTRSKKWMPHQVTVVPERAKVGLKGKHEWTVDFQLQLAGHRPEGTELYFADAAAEWGRVNPITFKSLRRRNVTFPRNWSAARRAAYMQLAQETLNSIRSKRSRCSLAQASLALDPARVQHGNRFKIRLPYTIAYFVRVGNQTNGPFLHDPEIDIDPMM